MPKYSYARNARWHTLKKKIAHKLERYRLLLFFKVGKLYAACHCFEHTVHVFQGFNLVISLYLLFIFAC